MITSVDKMTTTKRKKWIFFPKQVDKMDTRTSKRKFSSDPSLYNLIMPYCETTIKKEVKR